MKTAFLVSSFVMLLSGAVSAQSDGPVNSSLNNEKKVCKKLYDKADAGCTKGMCDDYFKEYGEKCVIDGDFNEGLGICVNDYEFPELIAEYNKKNPKKKIKCEDF